MERVVALDTSTQELEEKLATLNRRSDEQQETINEMARQLSILTNYFDDLKSVDGGHESHTLLLRQDSTTENDNNSGEDVASGDILTYCTTYLCCCWS